MDIRKSTRYLLLFMIMVVSFGCATDSADNQVKESQKKDVIEVVTKIMDFHAPDTIPSGWVTIRYRNESEMAHFAILERMPAGIGLQEHQDSVAPVFQNIMDNINGDTLHQPELGMTPPSWFGDIVFISGPGLLSPGQSAETSVLVEPGTYLLECYVKTNGIFHSYNPDPEIYGMMHEFTVTRDSSGGTEPSPTVTVDISSEAGMVIRGDINPGRHTVAVNFVDQKVYDNFVGHDLHVVRLDADAQLDSLTAWLNWMTPDGLQTPAPEGFTFLGGTNEMPAGSTGYFTVDFTPGEYVFVSEVPDPASFGLLKQFTVANAQ